MEQMLQGNWEEKGKEPDCSSWLPTIDLLPGLLMNVGEMLLVIKQKGRN